MISKIGKLNAEIAKSKAKISEWQARLREQERQKTECENTEIVELVRGVKVSPQELASFIKAFREKDEAPILMEKREEPDNEKIETD